MVKAQPRMCYRNAILGLLYLQKDLILDGKTLLYVEGLACIKELNIPMEHGWIQTASHENACVIDPTWYDHEGEIAYFPIVLFNLGEVRDRLDETGMRVPFVMRYGAEHRQAYLSAWREAGLYAGYDFRIPEE